MIDIFSRKAIHQEVHLTETGDLAAEFTENAIAANGGARPGYIHGRQRHLDDLQDRR
jgi:putative transposase